jgi:hypothetical protein
MASNPFFSGRIPQELLDQVEKHVQETGESKTNILIRALAAYLEFPIKLNSTSNSDLEKRVYDIEQQIVKLLDLGKDLSEIKQIIFNQNQFDNIVIARDNTKTKPAENNNFDDRKWQSIGEMTIVEILKLPNLEIENETKFRDKLRMLNGSKKKITIVSSYQFEVIGKESGAKGKIIYRVYKQQ